MTLIALDLDGTLEDSRKDMVAAIQVVRKQLELPSKTFHELVPHVMRGMPHLYRHCFKTSIEDHSLDDAEIATLATLYDEAYRQGIAIETQLYPGMDDALTALGQVGKLAVVTNKPEALSRLLLGELGILHHFATVVGGDSAPSPKPTPAPLAEAAHRTKRTEPVLMIGDSAGDVRCGRAFGATTIWCAWGYHAKVPEPAPDYIVSSPSELPEIVNRILSCC